LASSSQYSRPLLVDRAIGSGELASDFAAAGYPSQVTDLKFGDFVWEGNGPDGPVSCAVERKKIPDLITSLHGGRFAGHQLPGLTEFNYSWLVVEGAIRPDPRSGILQTYNMGRERWMDVRLGKHSMMYGDLVKYLTTLEVMTPLKVCRTRGVEDTVRTVGGLFDWWQKDWADHGGHLGFHYTQPIHMALTKPSFMRRVAKELDGIGWERSKAVEAKFPTLADMALADPEEWRQIAGIGPGIAAKVVKQIRGEWE
jgi:ERCC4-type nuclease